MVFTESIFCNGTVEQLRDYARYPHFMVALGLRITMALLCYKSEFEISYLILLPKTIRE